MLDQSGPNPIVGILGQKFKSCPNLNAGLNVQQCWQRIGQITPHWDNCTIDMSHDCEYIENISNLMTDPTKILSRNFSVVPMQSIYSIPTTKLAVVPLYAPYLYSYPLYAPYFFATWVQKNASVD